MSTLVVGLALNVTGYTVMGAMLFRGLPRTQRGDRLVDLMIRWLVVN